MTATFQKPSQIVLLSLLLTGSAAYNQTLSSSWSQDTPIFDFWPDTLFFSTLIEHDSIWVLNIGESDLLIDSIKTANRYGWSINIIAPEDTFWLEIPFYIYHEDMFKHFPIKISSHDSALFIFAPPDLCPVCKANSGSAPFEESLYFFSNDILHSPSVLFAHGEGFTGVSDYPSDLIRTFELKQNYPNPFNPTTRIDFFVPKAGAVQVFIYDLQSRRIRTVVSRIFQPGEHSVEWDGRNQNGQNAASGIYLCRLVADGISTSRKLTLLR